MLLQRGECIRDPFASIVRDGLVALGWRDKLRNGNATTGDQDALASYLSMTKYMPARCSNLRVLPCRP